MAGETNLMDILDHQPEILEDAKIRATVSDIYDNLLGFSGQIEDKFSAVAQAIAEYGLPRFIEWFINTIYLPNTEDIKVIGYVSDNKDEIIGILRQALTTLTPKEVLQNLNDEKVEGADEATKKSKSEDEVIDQLEIADDEIADGANAAEIEQTLNAEEQQPESQEASDAYLNANSRIDSFLQLRS